MLIFTKNRQTMNLDVIGPADEIATGLVTVTKKDKTTTTVTIEKLTKPFKAGFGWDGLHYGLVCRIGTVAAR